MIPALRRKTRGYRPAWSTSYTLGLPRIYRETRPPANTHTHPTTKTQNKTTKYYESKDNKTPD